MRTPGSEAGRSEPSARGPTYMMLVREVWSSTAATRRLAGLCFWSTVADTLFLVQCRERGFCWDPVELQT